MKQGRTLLACLLTAAAVVGGFFLPELVAAVQERTAQSVQVETGPVQLFSASALSLREKLMLMSTGSVEWVELECGRNLDEDAALATARAYATGFSRAAMDGLTVSAQNAVPYYNMFSDTGASFYIWECYFIAADGSSLWICLDDETGCLLQLSWVNGRQASDELSWAKRVYAARDYLMDVCAKALGTVYDGSSYAEEPDQNLALDEMSGQVVYCHMLEPETNEVFDIPIWYNEVNFYFNMFP